jgi:hypothetical protein
MQAASPITERIERLMLSIISQFSTRVADFGRDFGFV